MRLLNINGRLVTKNVTRYRINWGGKSRSKIQFTVKQFLQKYWKDHVVFEEFPVYGSRLKVDFLNATNHMAIEVNGGQHEEYNEFFHNKSRVNFFYSLQRDAKKEEWLERNKFTLIQIKEEEINKLSREYFETKFGVSII